MKITKGDALVSLCPNAQFVVKGTELDAEVVWVDPAIPPVTDEQIATEVARLQAAYESAEYQRQRASEYPPITDYLDGVVKGDQTQIDKYIADCLAVKAKYPKG